MAKIDVSKLLPQANKTAGIVKRTTTLAPKKYVPIAKSLAPAKRDSVDADTDDIDEVHVKEVDRVESIVGKISNLLMSSEAFKARRAERERKLLVSADRKKKEEELEADKAEGKFNGPKLLRKVVGGGIIDAIYRFFLYTFLGAIFNSTKDIIPPLIKTFGKVLDPIAKIFTSIVGFLFEGFIFFVDLGFKVHDTIRGTVKFLGGDFGVKIFDAFTSGLTTFVNTALIVGMMLASAGMMPDFGLGGGGKRGASPGSRPGGKPGTRPPAPGARPGVRPPAPGARPSRPGGPAARPGAPQVRPPAPGMPRGGVGRGVGHGAGKVVAKGASRVGSKFVPFIGPLIDFAIRTLVFGDSPGRAAAGAVGVAAGQALGGWLGGIIGVAAGSVVPLIGNLLAGGAGALIGSVIGGFVGDAIGTTLYDMLIEKTQNKPQKKATGGKISPTPARSTTKTVTRRRRLKVNSKTQQKQRTEPGKDIGGKNIIQKLFPDTDSPDGGGESGGGGVLGWAKRMLGMDEQSKEKGKRGNPYKALTETSDILKKIPVVGGIMGASIDIALGQKPHDMVYNQLGESIAAIIQSAGERSSAEALRQIVAAYASGGVITDSTRGTDTSNLGASLGKAFKHAIGIESAIAIRNIQTESSKKGVRSGAERTGEWEGSRGAPGLDEGDVGKPKPGAKPPAGGGQGGARGGGSSPGSIQPTQPKAPGVPGAAPGPAPASGGGGGGNVNVTMTQNQKKALDILSKYESASSGGYNAVNQIGVAGGRGVKGYAGDFRKMDQHGGRALTDMTIAEIMALQAPSSMSDAEWIKRGRLHAVGRYQFIGGTLPGVVQRAGIPKDAKFTKEVQDLLALQYMKEAGIGAWIGPADHATAEERRIIEAARKDPIKFSRAQGKAGAPVVASKPPGKPLGGISQHLHGDPNRPGYDYSGHGTQGNAHDHFSFTNRETAIAAYKALKAAGYDVTEFEGYGRVGSHSARGGHFGRHGHDPTYEDASDGVAFDVPWYQFGSGAIGKRDFEKSREVERIVKQAISGQITSADGSTKVWDTKTKSWVAGIPGTSPASTAQRKVGQSAVLNGKPVVWDGSKWAPKRDASGNILSKIGEALMPKAGAAQGPASPGYGGGGQGSSPTSRGGPSTPARTQAARAAVRPTPKPAPKPVAKPAPKRAWYDPRGWVGKEEGGRLAPTPSRNDFDSLKSQASYEGTDSQVMIQPIIIDNFVPMPMPTGTTSFGHGAARGAGGAGLNKTYKRNSLSRH